MRYLVYVFVKTWATYCQYIIASLQTCMAMHYLNTSLASSRYHKLIIFTVHILLLHSRSPASSPLALTVGGTRRGDNLYNTPNDGGTNFGRCVNIFAPGQNIRSAGFSSRTAVATFSGTSFATPLVSGAAAIYWNRNRNAGPRQLRNIIITACTRNRIDLSEITSANQRRQTPNCLLFV